MYSARDPCILLGILENFSEVEELGGLWEWIRRVWVVTSDFACEQKVRLMIPDIHVLGKDRPYK